MESADLAASITLPASAWQRTELKSTPWEILFHVNNAKKVWIYLDCRTDYPDRLAQKAQEETAEGTDFETLKNGVHNFGPGRKSRI